MVQSKAEPPTGSVLFDLIVTDGGVGVATEQQFQAYRSNGDGSVLEAAVPDNGSILLDYSLVVTSPEPDRHRDATAAAQELAGVFTTHWAQDVFGDHGFRDPAGHPLPDGSGLGEVTTMTLSDESMAQEVLQAWAVLALPGSVQAGLWVFADDIGGGGQDHREVQPIRRLDDVVDGHAHRDLMNSLSPTVAGAVADRSALYDTTLAAFRHMQDTYDPRAINSVIVLTDGRDDGSSSIGRQELLATLERELNPARPVVIVTVGITADADADALAAISEVTGGTSYSAREPGDLSAIFVSALADRAN